MTGPKLANLRQGFRGKPLAAEGLFALEPAPKFASKEFFPFISEINLCGCPNVFKCNPQNENKQLLELDEIYRGAFRWNL